MIVLWLHGDPQDWELDEWPAKGLVETWGPRQVPIRFVVRADAIRSADITTRQSLARLVQRAHTAELVEWIDGVIAATPLAAHLVILPVSYGRAGIDWRVNQAPVGGRGGGTLHHGIGCGFLQFIAIVRRNMATSRGEGNAGADRTHLSQGGA